MDGLVGSTLQNVTAIAGSGQQSSGIFMDNLASPIMNHVTAFASGGISNFGLRISPPYGVARVNNSDFTGNTAGISLGITTNNTLVRVSNTRVVGGVSDTDAGTQQCHNVYDADFNAINC